MDFINLFENYALLSILAIITLGFIAGFIDAVIGGGGLIQLPALLINLPNASLPSLFGTNKIAGLSGTIFSTYHYAKRIKYDFKLLFFIAFFSFIASNLGAKSLSIINPNTLRPIILSILILIAFYTFFKKDLGSIESKNLSFNKQILFGSLIGIFVGFYDGFFGPAAGSFFILGFVVLLGFEFVKASAYAKIINCVTNISALIVFVKQGNFLLELSILLAISNVMGSIIGTKLALKKGNGFIRIFFLVIVTMMILRYSYDIFINY